MKKALVLTVVVEFLFLSSPSLSISGLSPTFHPPSSLSRSPPSLFLCQLHQLMTISLSMTFTANY